MKKLFISIAFICVSVFTIAQTEIARYSSGSFTIYLDQYDKSIILNSIMAELALSDCTLDSAVIDDPDPSTIDSAAYIVFYLTCGSKEAYTIGFYLTKQLDHGDIKYNIDDDNNSVARAWKCTKDEPCDKCRPVRNWFLGPVVDCDCEECDFETSGGQSFPWGAVIGLIGVIITLL